MLLGFLVLPKNLVSARLLNWVTQGLGEAVDIFIRREEGRKKVG